MWNEPVFELRALTDSGYYKTWGPGISKFRFELFKPNITYLNKSLVKFFENNKKMSNKLGALSDLSSRN